MAVKKRQTLRSKSLKKTDAVGVSGITKRDQLLSKIAEKSEKREIDNNNDNNNDVVKHTLKSNSRIQNELKDPKEVGISKSAIRRRKRKLRDELRPKLTEDLLDALTESTNTTIKVNEEGIEELVIAEKVKLDHTPNPLNKRGEMALYKIENEEFKNVMKNKELRNGSGLSALRNRILNNMNNQN